MSEIPIKLLEDKVRFLEEQNRATKARLKICEDEIKLLRSPRTYA